MKEEEFYLEDLKSKFRKLKNVGGYNKYYLSYSGGKDSHLLYWFIKEYSYPEFKDIKIVGVNTFMEHHEILKRIQNNCDIVLIPKMKPFEIKEKYGSPCFSKNQDEFIMRYQKGSRTKNTMNFIMGINPIYRLNKKARELLLDNKLHKISPDCCKYLKKETVHKFEKETGLKCILGVRGSEGLQRKNAYKSCFTKDKKFTPLWDLTNDLEEKIYNKYNIEIPEVYENVRRTGCMGCPYSKATVNNVSNIEKELSLLKENQKKFVCEYFKESYQVLGVNTNIEKQTTIEDFINE